jgi:GAF domain-containing protein
VGIALPGDDRHDFVSAIAELAGAAGHGELCGPFQRVVGASGAVISTLGHPLGSQTVCATDSVAARIDEIQIDLGEGPCWEALRSRRPVLLSDFRRVGGEKWPGARSALGQLNIQSLHAFPLFVGRLDVGCVDLYSYSPRVFTSVEVEDVATLAALAARHVLRRALDDLAAIDDGIADGRHSRRELHQASGMVAAQLRITADDAALVIRAHAYAASRPVMDVAADVIARRTSFEQ